MCKRENRDFFQLDNGLILISMNKQYEQLSNVSKLCQRIQRN